ncbi:MAG: CYTH domain-containing protein [Paludibacteraceae bacterium]|jgi:adenylate cyclase|nr:CYTH domain-containing protein [Paludibacteraceae bacterium]
MAKEIERKFLVENVSYRKNATSKRICQGYICAEKDRVVRVRIYGEKAFLTLKNASIGFSRDEFEYEIPMNDAESLLERCCIKPIIEKIRYKVFYKNFCWEIDEFQRENEGLIIAEIELPDETTKFEKPDFIGEEVTCDVRYYNANLIKHPYCQWKK